MESEKKTEKTNNRDIDLVKTQIYTDRVNAFFTTYSSFMLAVLAGGIVLALTIRYSNIPYAEIVSPTLMGIFLVFATVGLVFLNRNYAGDIEAISKMIETVKEGQELPPLNEIVSQRSNRKNKNKKKLKAEKRK